MPFDHRYILFYFDFSATISRKLLEFVIVVGVGSKQFLFTSKIANQGRKEVDLIHFQSNHFKRLQFFFLVNAAIDNNGKLILTNQQLEMRLLNFQKKYKEEEVEEANEMSYQQPLSLDETILSKNKLS